MKRALIVGINYPGTGHQLQGCVNDANNMAALLKSTFGFEDIKILTDLGANTADIKAGMSWLVAGAVPGDVLVMHYSGHGSQLPSTSEPDGYEEIICPMDLDWVDKIITDNDLRACFNQVPNGVNTSVILDCCHSGGGMNQDAAYSTAVTKTAAPVPPSDGRYLEPPEGLTADRTHVVQWSTSRDINASALLLAAAHADQTSADATIGGIHQGAHTYAVIKEVTANPNITYKQLTDNVTMYMVSNGYTQRPELDGFPGLYDSKVLQPFGAAVVASVPPTTPTVPVTAEKKDNSVMYVLIGVAVAIVLFLALH